MNPWVRFLKDNSGHNRSVTELRDMYLEHKASMASVASVASVDPMSGPVYKIDEDADIKTDSMLETFKEEYDVVDITRKIEATDVLTEQETEIWKLAFEMALTDDYALTKEQLLGSHNSWLTRLEYHSGMDGSKFHDILTRLKDRKHKDLYAFLDDVLASFTVEELHIIGLPDLR